jgi:hypothetical protein
MASKMSLLCCAAISLARLFSYRRSAIARDGNLLHCSWSLIGFESAERAREAEQAGDIATFPRHWPVDFMGTKEEHTPALPRWNTLMSSSPQSNAGEDDGLEAAVDQAIAACGGDTRSAIRALIVANEYLESEVSELMKAVSRAYSRGRFLTYSG